MTKRYITKKDFENLYSEILSTCKLKAPKFNPTQAHMDELQENFEKFLKNVGPFEPGFGLDDLPTDYIQSKKFKFLKLCAVNSDIHGTELFDVSDQEFYTRANMLEAGFDEGTIELYELLNSAPAAIEPND